MRDVQDVQSPEDIRLQQPGQFVDETQTHEQRLSRGLSDLHDLLIHCVHRSTFLTVDCRNVKPCIPTPLPNNSLAFPIFGLQVVRPMWEMDQKSA